MGIWSLIAWQATFYERAFGLPAATYGPMLAVILPVGGILGGVGGGLLGDKFSRVGKRPWLTAGATFLAAPALAGSLLSSDSATSFACLFVGTILSECWRANAAVMIRTVSPPGAGSTSTALWLAMRNVCAAAGPAAVAVLADRVGLRDALLVAPGAFLVGGGLFFLAEKSLVLETRERLSDASPSNRNEPR